MHSLELLLDEAGDAAVRADWDRLTAAGLPSSGRHGSPSNAPHITLVAAPSLAPEAVPGVDDRVAAAAGFVDLPLVSAGVLLFGPRRGGYVLVRQLVTTPELLELHRRVCTAVHPVPGQVRTSVPGAWTPHVTLARRLSPAQVAEALAVLAPPPEPLRAVGLRRWDSDARTTVRLA
ncbi:hypothetical protein AS188_02630 [Kocuria flava]|uniref:2'-5' RNA ligase n=1 Tax=Kocuria flava TaxID=446860 RepID=A0A0U3HCB9_9MICC|nr:MULTISPECIES: 2'-5' RNA ligase family protein [Kocuria]ALU38825.1 hypothetical protein AS188_02630 [Kocuria flava]MCD1144349.1 2'-5' RNA ligase family protein [Kocuria sp. LUK]MCJ8504128.1 2'-5' RNA ligase family protein [Kocuria flava]PLC11563.1 hypothetical protein AUQ48_04015 [Kocuria flava]